MIRSPLDAVVAAFGFETLTVSNSVKTVTKATARLLGENTGARHALFSVETQPIRFRYDGGDPTASVGHLIKADQFFEIHGMENLRQLKMIATVAGDATVHCTYAV